MMPTWNPQMLLVKLNCRSLLTCTWSFQKPEKSSCPTCCLALVGESYQGQLGCIFSVLFAPYPCWYISEILSAQWPCVLYLPLAPLGVLRRVFSCYVCSGSKVSMRTAYLSTSLRSHCTPAPPFRAPSTMPVQLFGFHFVSYIPKISQVKKSRSRSSPGRGNK